MTRMKVDAIYSYLMAMWRAEFDRRLANVSSRHPHRSTVNRFKSLFENNQREARARTHTRLMSQCFRTSELHQVSRRYRSIDRSSSCSFINHSLSNLRCCCLFNVDVAIKKRRNVSHLFSPKRKRNVRARAIDEQRSCDDTYPLLE